jgi:hypothetical protein
MLAAKGEGHRFRNEQMIAEREARFAVIDRLRDKTAGIPPEEVLADVAEAIQAVRAKN